MSQERSFGNSGAEHHPEPNHPQPTEEATVVVPTPNRFWRMMTDPGFPSPASNPAPFMVTTEAFLDLTSQVQALAGMVQTIVPYLPQLVHSTAHQSAPPAAPPQTESPTTPNRRAPHEVEPPQRQCTPKTDHCLPPGDGPRERRAPLPVRGAVHITGLENSRPSSVPSHPSVLDGAETVEVLLVADRATTCDPARDAATGASVRGSRDAGSRQAKKDKAPPGGAFQWTSHATAKEKGR
ncbi:hypothetical protein B296_00016143 [Ensete ventricosum]|uniref:Uncharacterized protein n=1 Tax=Ensete ventricosum TaxID=4639 RepID=A0A427B4S2_ENSVE|nr:hypothetical protein B296_00016143 [Ensete ventricosum]